MNTDPIKPVAPVGGTAEGNKQPVASTSQVQPASRPYVDTYSASTPVNSAPLSTPAIPSTRTAAPAPQASNPKFSWRNKRFRVAVLVAVALLLVGAGTYAANNLLTSRKQNA